MTSISSELKVLESTMRTYANTVLEFAAAPDRPVDLRAPVGPAERALLAELGLDGPFAVLTAYNPYGQNGDPHNPQRQSELEGLLRGEGLPYVRLDGCSPDRTHREPSVAVRLPEARARQIALRFEQDAIFWYDGTVFHLVGAGDPLGRVRLPFPFAHADR